MVQNNFIINDNKEINELSKQGKNEKEAIGDELLKINLKQYFKEQYEKYSKYIMNINDYFLFDLANGDYYVQIVDKFKFKINYIEYPIITRVFNNILKMLEPNINISNYLSQRI